MKKSPSSDGQTDSLDVLHQKAEEKLRAQSERLQKLSSKDIRALVHELGTHQIELEMQNEELRRAQEELEASRSRYAELYDFAPVGYFTFDKDGLVLEVNLAGSQLLGVERALLLHKPFIVFIAAPADREIYFKHLGESSQTAGKQTCEIRLMRKDGTVFYAQLQSIAMENKDGHEWSVRTAIFDTTDRKQRELALQASENRYQRLFETAQDGIFIVDVHTEQIIDVNPFLTKMLGYAASELLGKKVFEIKAFGDCAVLRSGFQELYKKGHVRYEHLRLQSNDGHMLDLEFFGRGYFDEHNKVIQCNLRDIALRKRAEEALANAHNALEERVKERTAELLGVNEKLLHEIGVRKIAEASLQTAFSEIKNLKEQLHMENIYLREELHLLHAHKDIIGNSDAIRSVLEKAEQVAGTDSTVLIEGDTGTGKELIAMTIHNLSSRRDRIMVKVNCAALPPTLIESELFGREKGAFTGALSKQIGRFELADASTIFLDEIDSVPLELQAKLLRVLESGEFERLGDPRTIKVNIRIISATNRDLKDAVSAGSFREDLYYRLNVFQINVPPLRERREDIMPLVWHFVKDFSDRMGKQIESIPQKSVQALQAYAWPGNIRELKNVIERAMIISRGPVLNLDIPQLSQPNAKQPRTLEDVDREHIISVLKATGWKVSGKNGAAEVLDLNPKTLESKVQKLGILRSKNDS